MQHYSNIKYLNQLYVCLHATVHSYRFSRDVTGFVGNLKLKFIMYYCTQQQCLSKLKRLLTNICSEWTVFQWNIYRDKTGSTPEHHLKQYRKELLFFSQETYLDPDI